MSLEVEIPSEYQGRVSGHLSQLRGVVTETQIETHTCVLKAVAPLTGLFDYANDLRSMTQGQGDFSMQPSHYHPVPSAARKSAG